MQNHKDDFFGFSQVVEVEVPVLAWLLCPALVPELLHSVVWERATSHVNMCMWVSTTHPPPLSLQGFRYLYLTPQDYTRISTMNSVRCEHVEEGGESR